MIVVFCKDSKCVVFDGVRLRALAAVQMAGVFLKRLVKRAKWKVGCVFKQDFGKRLLHGG